MGARMTNLKSHMPQHLIWAGDSYQVVSVFRHRPSHSTQFLFSAATSITSLESPYIKQISTMGGGNVSSFPFRHIPYCQSLTF